MCVSVKATCFQNVVVSRFSSVVVCRSLSHACIWICEGGCFCTKTSCDFQIALAGDGEETTRAFARVAMESHSAMPWANR